MCHRINSRPSPAQIAAWFQAERDVRLLLTDFFPAHDLFPTDHIPIIRNDAAGDWELARVEWGLLPSWWQPSARTKTRQAFQRQTFNARSETVDQKPSFRKAFKTRRCIIPVHRFYEGTKDHAAYFGLADSDLLPLAGLWETWEHEGERVESCTILTTAANSLVAEYHPRDRMPVILPDAESRRRWMSPDHLERQPLEHLFAPLPSHQMTCEPL